jgi:hypothetical protein
MADNQDDSKNAAKNKHAKALSALGASKGGLARAAAISPEKRRAIAVNAAVARWGNELPRETQHTGAVQIGPLSLPCAVLNNEKRVLTLAGLGLAFGSRKQSPDKLPLEKAPDGSANLPAFLSYGSIYKYLSPELLLSLQAPLKFRTSSGNVAYAYDAEVLPALCEAIIEAERQGDLRKNARIANAAIALYKGLARVGITALVDEATGYQADRARDALTRILEQFIAKELRPWVRTFPPEFYQEMFRLRNWTWKGMKKNRPQAAAGYTKDIVYARLAPGVLEELKRVTPRTDAGRPKAALHQSLTEDVGHPKLKEHLAVVTTLMRISSTWSEFMGHLNRGLPKFNTTLELLPPDPPPPQLPESIETTGE